MIITDHLQIKYNIPNNAKLIAFMDLDGTLTDGNVIYDGEKVSRKYYLQDGHALSAAKQYGIHPIVVTSSPITKDIEQRFRWLQIPVFSNCTLKLDKALIPEVALLMENFDSAHIGDDVNDEQLLRCVDHAFIPSNHNPMLRNILDKVGINYTLLTASGGNGAIRDYIKLLSIHP